MATPAHQPPSCDMAHGNAIAMDGSTTTLPELAEVNFLNQVLLVPTGNIESVLDALMARAASLGIPTSRPSTATSVADKANTFRTSGAESSVTIDTSHARTASTGSQDSTSTRLTSPSSDDGNQEGTTNMLTRKRSRNLTFGQYDKYLAQANPNLNQPKFRAVPSSERHNSTPSLFNVGTRKSYLGIRSSLSKIRRRRTSSPFPAATLMCCSACREDFKPDQALEKLPCGHSYCAKCLQIMINQSAKDEAKMPPRCCTQPIPGSLIRTILPRDEQAVFLKAVLQYSTPWESRVFCSNPACGEFIPPRSKIDPKHPFQVICRKCQTRVCSMCKRGAHPLGHDCPSDWELDAVLKMGEAAGWRRCYKCRSLVSMTQGCSHMTCRCKAQEILERRRNEEAAQLAAREAEEALEQEAAAKRAAEKIEAEKRTKASPEFQRLRNEQVQEMERFRAFERKTKWLMWTRQSREKLTLVEKHSGGVEKMKERHAKTSANLEDRQVQAELELRSSLEQSERNVRIRLKHMEAYCDGLGQNLSTDMPKRVVTERDLRELEQQYNVEKNMKQLHQAKINVMRDRQAKALEELVQRQEIELDRLVEKNDVEVENLESTFTDEEDVLATTFGRRKIAMSRRWELSMHILRKEQESDKVLSFSVLDPLEWPQEKDDASEDGLSAVEE